MQSTDAGRIQEYLYGEQIDTEGLIQDRDTIAALDLPEIEQVCGPLMTAGITMIAGAAGVGKSLHTLHMAAHIAAGRSFEGWVVPKPRRVLYTDGEMAPQYLQGRLLSVPPSGVPGIDFLSIIHLGSMAATDNWIDLGQQRWRDWYLSPAVFNAHDVFVFDTVSSLVMATEEVTVFSPQFWLQLESFHQQFRAAGKTAIWVDNLNKNGQVFGTALKHHKVDSLWLYEPWDGKPDRCKAGLSMSMGKNRGGFDEVEGNWYYGTDGYWTQEL